MARIFGDLSRRGRANRSAIAAGRNDAPAPAGCSNPGTERRPDAHRRLCCTTMRSAIRAPETPRTRKSSIGPAIRWAPSRRPSSTQLAIVNAPYGAWASDVGVFYADGTPLVAVTRRTRCRAIPAHARYAGLLHLQRRRRGRRGADQLRLRSRRSRRRLHRACSASASAIPSASARRHTALGGNETVSFDNARFTSIVAALLQPYRNLLPI